MALSHLRYVRYINYKYAYFRNYIFCIELPFQDKYYTEKFSTIFGLKVI